MDGNKSERVTKSKYGFWKVDGAGAFSTEKEARAHLAEVEARETEVKAETKRRESAATTSLVLCAVMVVAVVVVFLAWWGGGQEETGSEVVVACGPDTTPVGRLFRPLREVAVRTAPDPEAPQVLNQKATAVLGSPHYHSVSGEFTVYEHCSKGPLSYISVQSPKHLANVNGWVVTAEMTERRSPDDPYEGRIAEYIFKDFSDESLIHGSDPSDPTRGLFSSQVGLINQQKIEAARKAIDSGKCDYVSGSMFDRRASDKANLKYMVDCANGERFIISSSDLSSSRPVASQSEMAVSQPAAMRQCKALIQDRVTRPSSVRFSEVLDSSYYKAPTNGNVRLILGFDAENAYGVKTAYRATCIFEPSGSSEITIQLR